MIADRHLGTTAERCGLHCYISRPPIPFIPSNTTHFASHFPNKTIFYTNPQKLKNEAQPFRRCHSGLLPADSRRRSNAAIAKRRLHRWDPRRMRRVVRVCTGVSRFLLLPQQHRQAVRRELQHKSPEGDVLEVPSEGFICGFLIECWDKSVEEREARGSKRRQEGQGREWGKLEAVEVVLRFGNI